jgi:pilus assembly protein FimV
LTDEQDGDNTDTKILEEIEDASFDEILESIDDDVEVLLEDQGGLLDDSDLDLDALLAEHEKSDGSSDSFENAMLDESEEDFLDVDTLLNESIEAESSPLTERELDLDVSLEEYSGVVGDSDLIDVDGDQGIGAKLDLARAYIEMDDIDSAKSLLDEVVNNSEDDYHDEATALLAQIVKS